MGYPFKRITITSTFQKILDESNCKPSNIWVHKSIELYNRSMKSFLQKNLLFLKDSLEPLKITFINT